MKAASLLLVAGAALVAGPAMAGPRHSGEQQLAKVLAGRVAGKPVDCINPRVNSETRVIDRTAIVYGTGRTIYVQRPDNARTLRDSDVLLTELRGTGELCSIDVVKLRDPSGHWSRGFVSLNKFVPYTRVQTARRD